MSKLEKFAIIGGGAWGTALATMTARSTGSATIYTIEDTVADEINTSHTNSKYLGDTKLPESLVATTNLEDILSADVIIIAVPSHVFELILDQLKKLGLPKNVVLLIATKGLCSNPAQLFSSKLEEMFSNPYAFIGGPNFAKEVALGMLTSVTISSQNIDLAKRLAKKLESDNFQTTHSSDIITVQIAAIVKNIIAIKSGIMKASGSGENARALLMSHALAEIAAISKALGGVAESLTLPAVVGDLVLTCYSDTSRNTKFGYELHNNDYSRDFIDNHPVLVEGVQSARLLKEFISKYDLDLPMISSVMEVV